MCELPSRENPRLGWCVLCRPDDDKAATVDVDLDTGTARLVTGRHEAIGTRYGLPVCGNCGTVDPRDVAETLADMDAGHDGELNVEIDVRAAQQAAREHHKHATRYKGGNPDG